MSDDVLVREADSRDAETIATLFTEFNGILGADGLDEEASMRPENVLVTTEQMKQRLEAMAAVERAFLACVGDEAAGLACLRLVPYIGQDVPYAELTQMYVRKGYQRRGVGAALIAQVEHVALENGATSVHIITGGDNDGAQAFYRAQGYGSSSVLFSKFFKQASR
jgi:ribosomal protein S18 acetylase RimI-like enzyme